MATATLFFSVTMAFGGVHPRVAISLGLATGILLGISLRVLRDLPAQISRPSKYLSRRWTATLLVLALYLGVVGYLRALEPRAHPILGATSAIGNFDAFYGGIRDLLFAAAFFAVVRLQLLRGRQARELFDKLLLLCGLVVSLTALAHWFSDTGKLFWLFAPDNLFVSTRARWPFVNSNHLGHFLIPFPFLIGRRLLQSIGSLRTLVQSKGRGRPLNAIVSNVKLHRDVLVVALQTVTLLSVLLAIAASLSRGAWIGVLVGTLVWIVHGRSTKARVRTWTIRLAVVSLFTVAIYFFLGARGSEMVENRLEYGLLSSKEEIRGVLYRDTWQLFKESPLWGIGIGNWPTRYAEIQSRELAGVNPEYLHSDPYQLLVEGGLFAFSIVGFGIVPIVSAAWRSRGDDSVRCITAGLAGVVTASCFDFPFRVPAIVCLVVILVAILVARLEDREHIPLR